MVQRPVLLSSATARLAALATLALVVPAIAAPAAGPPDGRAVYQTHCAGCHDGGVERAPSRSTLAMMSSGAIERALTYGAMKVQGAALSAAERIAVSRQLSRQGAGLAAAGDGPACTGSAASFSDAPAPWSGWGIDLGNSHAIPAAVAAVTKADVGRLEVAWARALPNALRVRSQPNFFGGALFVGSHDGTVFALDERTGCVRWRFAAAAEVRTGMVVAPPAPGRSPAATLFFGDLVGTVYALDARTGRELWRARPDPHPHATITAAPALADGRLYVAVSSMEVLAADDPAYSCCTFRGSVVAYDSATGRKLWQTHTIPQPAKAQQPNAVNVMQFGPSGAPVWGSPSIDPKRRRLYVGTGENYSSPAESHSDSVIAMDLDSGIVRWVHQVIAGDAWNSSCGRSRINCPKENGPDADLGAATLFATTSDGRDLVLAGAKSGDLVALDPDSGKPVWRRRIGRGGMGGGIRFGMALAGDRLFVPTTDSPNDRSYPGPPQPGLFAVDIRTGTVVWQAASEDGCAGRAGCRIGNSGAITTTGGMVLVVGRDGWLRIHDTSDGRILARFATARRFAAINGTATGGAFSGAAAPVVHRGRIYVSSGYGFGDDIPGNLLLALRPAGN